MTIPENLQNLSKEQLLALLQSTQQELVVVKKGFKTFKKKAESLERKSNKYQQKCRELTNTNKHLEHQLQVSNMLIKEHIELMAEMTREANCRIVDADEVLAWSINQQLKYIFEESREWVQNAIQWRSQNYATGNDVKNEKIEASAQEQEQEQVSSQDEQASQEQQQESELTDEQKLAQIQQNAKKTAIVQSKRMVTMLKNKFTEQVKQTPENLIALCPDAIKAIYNAKTPEPKEHKHKKSRGRQKKDLEPTRSTKDESSPRICPDCGATLSVDEQGEFSKSIGSIQKELGQWTEYINVFCSLGVCNKCRKVHVFFDKNSDLPIKPNREFGLKLFLEACDNIFMGHPLLHLSRIFNLELKYGHSTVINNMIDGADIYLKPWCKYILDKARKSKYLIADGTRFPCLETQGRGCSQLKKKDVQGKENSGGNNNEANGPNTSQDSEPSSSNYILGFCNVPLADEKFSCYDFLHTRSAKSIEKVLTDDFQFKTLICDAFGGYDTIVKQRGCFMQNCLVHLRRYIVNDVRPDDYAQELLKLSDSEFQAFVAKILKEGNDRFLLFTVLVAVSKIYALEASVDLNADDAIEQILAVRDDEKPLMSNLEKIMESLCSRHLVISEDGKKVKKIKGDPYARCCYYWYQRRKHFTVFLDDPMVPPDSNLVEQIIRPLTVLRKNSNFMNTEKGMKCLCMIFTVWATLKKNGFESPSAFLYPYCRELLIHCVRENYTHYYFDDGDEDPKKLSNKINTWNMEPLSEGFDFQKYFKLV